MYKGYNEPTNKARQYRNSDFKEVVLEKRSFIESLVGPEALSLLGHGAGMLGAHVASNAAFKKFIQSNPGKNFANSMASLGAHHGKSGRILHPMISDRITQLAGPEVLSEYRLARAMAEEGAKAPERISGSLDFIAREAYREVKDIPRLGVATKNVGSSDKPKGFISNLLDRVAVKKENLDNMSPTRKKMLDLGRKGLDAATVGAASMVPVLGENVAVNTIRGYTSRLPIGKKMIKDRIAEGLSNKQESSLKRKFIDYVVSPGVGELRDIGSKLKEKGVNQRMATPILDRLFQTR